MRRASGVLMHISMLWGEYSIGGFGKSAFEFIDFLSESGFSYWQILPLNPTDDFNSPYKSYSAFAGEAYFLDIEQLCQEGLISVEELSAQKQKKPYLCEYEILKERRLPLLKLAASRVDESVRLKINTYIDENPHLGDFCKFMALKEANKNREWIEFYTDDYSEETLFMWKFIQYNFHVQWKRVKGYANKKGISIIGDIPIYVSHDSSDVFFDREQFELDSKGNAKRVAGVPPDYFNEDGQMWGNPLYDWKRMKKDSYSWWGGRISYNLDMFDGIRIDHFRGLESFWSIPSGAESAKEGKWIKGGGKSFVKEISARSKDSLVIAEDLGEITPAVAELVRFSGFPGMRVFQFAFMGDSESPHLPHNYANNCVAYTGTHDNDTLLGFLMKLDTGCRRRVFDYCGYFGDNCDEGSRYVIKTMMSSHAGIVIFPIQDLLGYGSDTRMNTPGSAKGNWAVRFTREQISSIDKGYLRSLNELYGRI